MAVPLYGGIGYGCVGTNGLSHLLCYRSMQGDMLTAVPFRGEASTVRALMGCRICCVTGQCRGYADGGSLSLRGYGCAGTNGWTHSCTPCTRDHCWLVDMGCMRANHSRLLRNRLIAEGVKTVRAIRILLLLWTTLLRAMLCASDVRGRRH